MFELLGTIICIAYVRDIAHPNSYISSGLTQVELPVGPVQVWAALQQEPDIHV